MTRFLGDLQTDVYLLERVYAIKLNAFKTVEQDSLSDKQQYYLHQIQTPQSQQTEYIRKI